MDSPGVYDLGDFVVTTAATTSGTAVSDLDGMLAAMVHLRFAYGSGGTTATAYVQCSADQGTTWYDVASVLFGTASETQMINFSALISSGITEPTDGTMDDDTAIDGFLTDRMRVKVVSTGTYAGNTLLSARLVAR